MRLGLQVDCGASPCDWAETAADAWLAVRGEGTVARISLRRRALDAPIQNGRAIVSAPSREEGIPFLFLVEDGTEDYRLDWIALSFDTTVPGFPVPVGVEGAGIVERTVCECMKCNRTQLPFAVRLVSVGPYDSPVVERVFTSPPFLPMMPGDRFWIGTQGSGYSIRWARLRGEGETVELTPAGDGSGRYYSFDPGAVLATGTEGALELEMLDLDDRPFGTILPASTVPPEPGTRDPGSETGTLAGWSAHGVQVIPRGTLPLEGEHAAIAGWGRLAFDADIPPEGASLVVVGAAVAAPWVNPIATVEVAAIGSRRTKRGYLIWDEPLGPIRPLEVPLGPGGEKALLVQASPAREKRYDLSSWAGERISLVLSVRGGWSFFCGPSGMPSVVSGVAIDEIRLE